MSELVQENLVFHQTILDELGQRARSRRWSAR